MNQTWRIFSPVLFSLYLLLSTTFLLYSCFEFFPNLHNLVNLQRIRYYADTAEFLPDPVLVWVPRRPERVVDLAEFRGDSYSPEYGVDVPPIQYHASYTRDGFRTTSSVPPIDILVLGDSYIEIGEADDLTFSEILKQTSGLSTFNLGRNWYGPVQYLELFKRYGLPTQPKYALLCFFDGNDAEDIRQYLRWQRGDAGGDYRDFIVSRTNFFKRYLHALRDTYSFLRDVVKGYAIRLQQRHSHPLAKGTKESTGIHPNLALVQLNGQLVPMFFNSRPRHATAEELLKTEEWRKLRAVLTEFNAIARERGITPIVMFIPTKFEVYASFYSDQSGQRFLEQVHEQLRFETQSVRALEAITHEVKIQLVNLLPYFKELAKEGVILYYPLDSHWNVAGRKAAAQLITNLLLNPDRTSTPWND